MSKKKHEWTRKGVTASMAVVLAFGMVPAVPGVALADTVNGVESFVSTDTLEYIEVANGASFSDAVSKGSSVAIKLTNDITLSEVVTVPAEAVVSIDLNGHAIEETGAGVRKICNYGQMAITTTVEGGVIKNTDVGSYGLIDNYGSLVIEGGTYEDVGGDNGASLKNRGASSRIEIKDGNFSAKNNGTSGNACVYSDGTLVIHKGDFSNKSGEVDKTGSYCVISNSGAIEVLARNVGDVVIDGEKGGIAVNSGRAKIVNANVVGHNWHGLWITNDGVSTSAEISGGSYEGGHYGVYAAVDDGGQDQSPVKIAITDGVFKGGSAAAIGDRFSNHQWCLSIEGGNVSEIGWHGFRCSKVFGLGTRPRFGEWSSVEA